MTIDSPDDSLHASRNGTALSSNQSPKPSSNDASPTIDLSPLALAVSEIDNHLAAAGWDQPIRLFALVLTENFLLTDPALAVTLGLPDEPAPGALTPVEQDELEVDAPLDEWLGGISWPPEVAGCALAQEVLALPPSVEADVPEGTDAVQWAATHPLRRDVRMVVGVLRDGTRFCSLRVRAINADDDVVTGPDLVPLLAEALADTLTD